MQAELQADGVGDHIFLLRLAEATAARHLEKDLVDTLRLNGRGLAFARKVRPSASQQAPFAVNGPFGARPLSNLFVLDLLRVRLHAQPPSVAYVTSYNEGI